MGRRSPLSIAALLLWTVPGCKGTPLFSEPNPPTVEGARYMGDSVCGTCHAAESKEVSKTVHGRLAEFETLPGASGCEGCHGPGSLHAQQRGAPGLIVDYKDSSPSGKQESAGYCLSCHNRESHHEWDQSQHAGADVSCTDCHNPMRSSEKLLKKQEPELCYSCHLEIRAQTRYPSHHPINEGLIRCSDCHNQHGSDAPSMIRADTVNDLCFRCHAEKEGPFAFEHPPATENCAVCHNPHGTVANSLLKESEPFLCLGCHSGHQGPLLPVRDTVLEQAKRKTFFTKCTQCHSTIHGTDLPSTSEHGRFTR